MTDTLAQHLQAAHDDPSQRAAFYRSLWEATVYTVGTSVQEGGNLNLNLSFFERDGVTVVPFFSSESLFLEKMPLHHEMLTLTGRQLLAALPDKLVPILNPGTESSKTFTATELRALRAGLLFQDHDPSEQPAEELLLEPPTEELAGWVDVLREYFDGMEGVEQVYLAQGSAADNARPPFPVVAIERSNAGVRALADLQLDLLAHARRRFGQAVDFALYDLNDSGTSENVRRFFLGAADSEQ